MTKFDEHEKSSKGPNVSREKSEHEATAVERNPIDQHIVEQVDRF